MESLKCLDGGTYTLIIYSDNCEIKVGSIGILNFHNGVYTYTGSALNKKFGLYNRVNRHLSYSKKLKWHIDYLLNSPRVKVKALCASHSDSKFECIIASGIQNLLNAHPIIGFGSSDCKCLSHLHFFGNVDHLKVLDMIYKLYIDFGLKPIKMLFS